MMTVSADDINDNGEIELLVDLRESDAAIGGFVKFEGSTTEWFKILEILPGKTILKRASDPNATSTS